MAPLKLNVPLPSLGLVVDRPGEFVDQRAVAAIKNMEFNRSIIRKRIGTVALGATLGQRVQRMFDLQVGSATRLVRVGKSKVEAYNATTGAWASIASAALTAADTDMVSYAYPTLSGSKIAVYTNAVDAIRKVTMSGNDAVLGGSPPKAHFVQAYGPYLVLANIIDGGNTFPSRVQWPDTGLPESWTPGGASNAGSQDLLDDPDDITGLGLFGSFLTVHKSRSIYLGQLVSTADVFRFDRRATGVGAASGASIQSLPSGEQIFLAADGIHLFNGMTAPLIDSPIQDELREGLNPAYLYKAQSVFVAELDEYWVAVAMGSDTEPQTVYKYNWRTRQAYKDTRANLTTLGLFLNTQSAQWNDQVLAWDSDAERWDSIANLSQAPTVTLGYSDGTTARRSPATNDDAGTAVDGVWDTKDFGSQDLQIPDMDVMVRWKGIKLWAKGRSVKGYYSTDGGTTWLPAGTLTLGSDYPADSAPLLFYFDAVSTRLRIRFENSNAGESFTVKKYQVMGTPREAIK